MVSVVIARHEPAPRRRRPWHVQKPGISQIWLCLRVRNLGEERPSRLLVSAGRSWCLVFGWGRAPHDLSQRYAFPRRQRVMARKRLGQDVEGTVQPIDSLLGLPQFGSFQKLPLEPSRLAVGCLVKRPGRLDL
jgi:hypothetical protein